MDLYPRLQVLELTGNDLTELPARIGQLKNLRELRADANRIERLPPTFDELTNLVVLSLSQNFLESLPPQIDRLTRLRSIYLGGNRLRALPRQIGNLPSLVFLHLTGNRLLELPAEMGRLGALRRLWLGFNDLVKLPPEIGDLSALTDLDLDDNKLISLPSEFGNLRSLERLSVRRNHLVSLPKEMGGLSKLSSLLLSGNPLESPPVQIRDRGTVAILRFLRGEIEPDDLSPPLPSPGVGVRFEPGSSGRLEISHGELLNDEERTKLSNLRNMLLAEAQRLKRLVERSNALQPIKSQAELYADLLEKAPLELGDGDIEVMYACGLSFQVAQEKLSHDIANGFAPPTDLDAAVPLQVLNGLHGPFIQSTARGKELYDQADRDRRTRDEDLAYRERALALSQALQETGDLVTDQAKAIVTAVNEGIGQGRHPERTSDAARNANRNLLIAAAKLVTTPEGIAKIATGTGGAIVGAAILSSSVGAGVTSGGAALVDAAYQFLLHNDAILRGIAAVGGEALTWLRPFLDWLRAQTNRMRRRESSKA